MAPVATPNIPSPPSSPAVAVGKNFGNYKEQAAGAKVYNKKVEEEGDDDHPKANVFRALPYDGKRADSAL